VKHTTRMHEILSPNAGAVGAPTRRVDKTLNVDDPAGGPMVHRTHTPDMPGACEVLRGWFVCVTRVSRVCARFKFKFKLLHKQQST
jgi:hypothetical protein